MNNLYIIWHGTLEIGVPILDEQHRGLATAVNTLYYGMGSGRGKDMLIRTISIFELLADIHFYVEEEIMKATNVPNLDRHSRAHDKLRCQLNTMLLSARRAQDPSQLLDFFKAVWMTHFDTYDRQIVEHLQAYKAPHSPFGP